MELAGDTLRVDHNAQNRGQGVTKDQYVETEIESMEKENVFDEQHAKWFDIAANAGVHLRDGSKQACCLNKRVCQQEQLENI